MHDITGVVLAGGRGLRMDGHDKGLMKFNGRPLVAHVIERVRPQVGAMAINANRNLEDYREFGLPVWTDMLDDHQGPLAGFATALAHATTPWILIVPCDSPFIPVDLVDRLGQAAVSDGAGIAVVATDGKLQPVFTLVHHRVAESLKAFLARGDRKIALWLASQHAVRVDCTDIAEAFTNINTVADLEHAAAALPDTGAPPA